MGNKCPEGYIECGGVCYQKCSPGYANQCEECVSVCPNGWTEDGDYCIKPPNSSYNNNSFSTDNECAKVAGQCYQCLGSFYPQCLPGFDHTECNKCTLICPGTGEVTVDNRCRKKRYRNPNTQPASLSTSVIIIIITLVIISVIIFYMVYYQNRRVTSDTVFDIEYGTPGVSDTYALITGEKASQKLIYV